MPTVIPSRMVFCFRLLAGIAFVLAVVGCNSSTPSATTSTPTTATTGVSIGTTGLPGTASTPTSATSSAGGTTGVATGQASTPAKSSAPVAGAARGVFPYKDYPTDSASLALDAGGGIHMTFGSYSEPGKEAPDNPGYYAYCPAGSDCTRAANFNVIQLGTNVAEAQIKLTPQGQPRILMNRVDYSQHGYNSYWYAACDSNCTRQSNWSITAVVTTTTISTDLYSSSKHYFALDPQGHPRFVYDDATDMDYTDPHTLYYASCDANCTSGGNWQLHLLPIAYTANHVLAFTAAGQPRIAAFVTRTDSNTFISSTTLDYLECNANCGDGAQWSDTQVEKQGAGVEESFVLRLDHNNRSRMAFYHDDHLRYMWCDQKCTDAGNWASGDPGLANGDGQDPDLAFDSRNRPSISFRAATDPSSVAGGLGFGQGYVACTAGCETPNAHWQKKLVESTDVLNTEYPYTRPINCAYSTWFGGYRSTLLFDGSGNPRIAYDAEYHFGGGFGCPINPNEDNRVVRLIFFNP